MAHFRDTFEGAGRLLFATLTLRPTDSQRLTHPERTAALRALFTSRLVRRIERAEGFRPRYLAQVDVNGQRDHHHLHALIETDLGGGFVAGMWVDSGGGPYLDIQVVQPTPDDIARVSGYIVEACRWRGTGRLMASRSVGYNSHEAVAQRAVYRDRMYGEQRSRELFTPIEPDSDRPERSKTPRLKPDLFVPSAPAAERTFSPVRLPGGEYGITLTYDPKAPRVEVVAVREVDDELRRLTPAHHSPKVLKLFLHRYDTRNRQRFDPERVRDDLDASSTRSIFYRFVRRRGQ